jgi:Flp pilus assembly protein TadG
MRLWQSAPLLRNCGDVCARKDAMKTLRKEEGQTLVLTALSMMILLAFMALAIDVGLLFRAKRNLQTAADAAATAAALDYLYNSSSGTAVDLAKTVGITAANDNLKVMGTSATTVVHSGKDKEITTPYHNSSGYFEAIVTQSAPTMFMGMFGVGTVPIAARAVAGAPGVNDYCVYILKETGDLGSGKKGDSTIYLQGSFTIKAKDCGILIDGTSSDTLLVKDAGGSLDAGAVAVVGGSDLNKNANITPAPVTGVAPVSDPMEALSLPTPSGCVKPTGGVVTGQVGTAGGTVCYTGNVTVQNAVLNGTVIFDKGDVTFGGSVSSGTKGSTIDITTGGMTENANTVFGLSAPTDGPYSGVVLMAPRTNSSIFEFEFGNSHGTISGTVNGIIYLPDAQLFLHDSGGDHSGGLVLNTDLIIGELNDQTASLTINSYSDSNPTLTPLKHVSLVE